VEKEQLFDIKENGGLVYEQVKNNVPAACGRVDVIRHL
jgi:hypothetical protein